VRIGRIVQVDAISAVVAQDVVDDLDVYGARHFDSARRIAVDGIAQNVDGPAVVGTTGSNLDSIPAVRGNDIPLDRHTEGRATSQLDAVTGVVVDVTIADNRAAAPRHTDADVRTIGNLAIADVHAVGRNGDALEPF